MTLERPTLDSDQVLSSTALISADKGRSASLSFAEIATGFACERSPGVTNALAIVKDRPDQTMAGPPLMVLGKRIG